MEITDEAHWADVFASNGTLTGYAMGREYRQVEWTSSASTAATTMAAAIRCGCRAGRLNSGAKIQVCPWRECFRSRAFGGDGGSMPAA